MECLTLARLALILTTIIETLRGYNRIDDLINIGYLENFNATDRIFSRTHAVEEIQEDINNPGSYIFSTDYGLKRYTPATGISMLCGNETERGYRDGPALDARFQEILDFVQYNTTRIAILDLSSGCMRDYDHMADYVTTLVGNCTGKNDKRYDLQTVCITSNVLLQPVSVVYQESTNHFLVSSLDGSVYKVNLGSKAIEKLNFKQADIKPVLYVLLNEEELILYAFHYCGASIINLTTLDSQSYIYPRDCYENELVFREAALERLYKPVWVIPNYIVITGTPWTQSILIADVKKKEVKVLCNGSGDYNQTITGSLAECKMSSPVSVFLFNDTAYISTLQERSTSVYYYTANSSSYQMRLNITRCPSGRSNDIDIHYPKRIQYDIYSSMTVSCPGGYGLNSSYSTVTCVESNSAQSTPTRLKAFQWDRPIPTCTGDLSIDSMTPDSGQHVGGTLVTATGIIPNEEFIHLYIYQPHALELNFTKNGNAVIFNMPPSNHSYNKEVTIEFILKDWKNNSRKFTFSYTYTNTPQLSNESLVNIKSGGLCGVFCLDFIKSAYEYTVTFQNGSKKEACKIEESCVFCPLSNCPSIGSDTCIVVLAADGVAITGGLVTILPDPVINKNNTMLPFSTESPEFVLTLYGSNLNLGYANMFYRVLLESPSGSSVNCTPLSGQITNTSLPCAVSRLLVTMNTTYAIKVHIGNLYFESGNVMFIQSPDKPGNDNSREIITSSVVVPAAIIVAIVVLVVRLRKRKYSMLPQGAKLKIQQTVNKDLLAEVKLMTINPSKLTVGKNQQVGKGHFGVIYLGQLHCRGNIFRVAIKTVKETGITEAMIEDFLKEAVLARKYYHTNVLPVIGICWSNECIPQVVLPYMANGDLKSILRKPSLMLTFGDLLHFAKQVACGMEYLSRKSFIHRDLAARNCLVSETYIVKISDFGLSRDLYNKDYYRLQENSCKEFPVKWLSIESLRSGLFTSSSDVWSFGVLLWEICTRGSDPYLDVDPGTMLSYLEAGNRLQQPSYCPDVIFDLMKKCWNEEMNERPSFTFIHEFLRQLVEGSTLEPVNTYSYVREYTKDIPDGYFDEIHQDENYEEIYMDDKNSERQRVPTFATLCIQNN